MLESVRMYAFMPIIASAAMYSLLKGLTLVEKEHEVLFIKGLRRKKLRFGVLPDSSLCQNGKQVEIITKMIFEHCYIEAHGLHRLHGFFCSCNVL